MEKRRTVLIVEDSESDAQMLERGLQSSVATHAVVIVDTTDAAEDYVFHDAAWAGGTRPNPDLIVLDVRIPPGGGVDFLDKIRSDVRTRTLPVVMVCGELRDQDVQDLYKHGVNSYLDKPLDSSEFSRLVGAAARYWLKLNLSVPPRTTSGTSASLRCPTEG
jgi:CheY-like chemotaxis protein